MSQYKKNSYKKKRYKEKSAKKKWIPPPMTEDYLRQATAEYLQKYCPSSSQLRQVLIRKIDKNIFMRNQDNIDQRETYLEWVEKEVAYRCENGDIQDKVLAEAWFDSLHKRGKSRFHIQGTLRQKGFSSDIINQLMQQKEDEAEAEEIDLAMEAAIQYARKRRLGPFQMDTEKREERYKKDIAAMLRAGHSYDRVKKILDCDSVDALEQIARER